MNKAGGVRKVGVVVNPIAGSGRGARILYHLVRQLNRKKIESVVNVTTKPWQAFEIAQHVFPKDIEAIICIGGDGTVNEVVNGLTDGFKNAGISLGVIPVGSGNVIAKELKLPHYVEPFTRLLEKGERRRLDVGSVYFKEKDWQRRFISMAGIGFDAEVSRVYHRYRQGADFFPHLLAYLPLTLKVNASYKLPRIKIELDGRVITEEASFIQVANARSYGGPFIFARKAQPDDGVLDVIWFKAQTPRDILRYYWYSHWYDVLYKKGAYATRGRHLRLSSDEAVPVQLDGDFSGYLPVEINIIPSAIEVISHSKKSSPADA